MGLPTRDAMVEDGPTNGVCWTQPLVEQNFPAASGEVQIMRCPPILVNAVGPKLTETLYGTGAMFNISQVLLSADATIAANLAVFALTFNLYRAGALVGGGGFAGFAAGTSPLFTKYVQTPVPFTIANTALVPANGATTVTTTAAVLPVKPGDVITCLVAIGAAGSFAVTLDGC